MNIKSFTDKALCVLFPRRCKYCGEVISPQEILCDSCEKSLPVINTPVCHFCGCSKSDCACKKKKSYYDEIVGAFYYTGSIAKAIDRMKFHEKKFMCDVLAKDMLNVIMREYSDKKFDVVTYIPFSQGDIKSREFNHSKELAKIISSNLNISFSELLKQIYEKPTQHLLSSNERKGNVFGIYEAVNCENIEGKTILLVDDIKTTGATLDECAKMLKLAGAKNVCCVVFAVTKKQNKNLNVEK